MYSTILDEAFAGDNRGGDRQNGYGEQSHFGGTRPFEEDRNSFLFSMLVLSSYIIKADGKIMQEERTSIENKKELRSSSNGRVPPK